MFSSFNSRPTKAEQKKLEREAEKERKKQIQEKNKLIKKYNAELKKKEAREKQIQKKKEQIKKNEEQQMMRTSRWFFTINPHIGTKGMTKEEIDIERKKLEKKLKKMFKAQELSKSIKGSLNEEEVEKISVKIKTEVGPKNKNLHAHVDLKIKHKNDVYLDYKSFREEANEVIGDYEIKRRKNEEIEPESQFPSEGLGSGIAKSLLYVNIQKVPDAKDKIKKYMEKDDDVKWKKEKDEYQKKVKSGEIMDTIEYIPRKSMEQRMEEGEDFSDEDIDRLNEYREKHGKKPINPKPGKGRKLRQKRIRYRDNEDADYGGVGGSVLGGTRINDEFRLQNRLLTHDKKSSRHGKPMAKNVEEYNDYFEKEYEEDLDIGLTGEEYRRDLNPFLYEDVEEDMYVIEDALAYKAKKRKQMN